MALRFVITDVGLSDSDRIKIEKSIVIYTTQSERLYPPDKDMRER